MPVNVEYVVRANENLTSAQRAAIYDLIMTYTFPMNTNPVNKAKILALPEQERRILAISEIDFLRHKIKKEISPKIFLSTIPKSLYQLFAINHLFRQPAPLKMFIPEKGYTTDEAFYSGICDFIKVEEYRETWWALNEKLCQAWDPVTTKIDTFVDQQFDVFENLLVDHDQFKAIPIDYVAEANWGRSLGIYRYKYRGQDAKFYIKRAAYEEYSEEEHYLLYCGLSARSQDDLSINPNLAWSFSDGILGGFAYDINSGCCLNYLIHYARPLWAYALDKTQYQTDSSVEHALFYVPPIPNLLRLTGVRNFHHPRTKLTHNDKYKCFGEFELTGAADVVAKLGKQPVFIESPLSEDRFQDEVKRLIRENYHLLLDNDGKWLSGKGNTLLASENPSSTCFGVSFSNRKRILRQISFFKEVQVDLSFKSPETDELVVNIHLKPNQPAASNH